jgi:CPA2 family monovalent cation:H+ antiporter-2
MPEARDFLSALAVVLCVAAVTTVAFQRLRQPVVLGYLLAGLIVGPHVPIPLVADGAAIRTLSELGVILLMFSLGLGFSLRGLVRVGPAAGLTALLETSVMLWLGFMAGRLMGWSSLESFFAGGVVAISSTTIVAKAFEERRSGGKVRDLVVGILVFEDLIAVLLIAILTGVASGRGLAAGPLVSTVATLAAFLVGLIAVGMLVVPRAVRAINRLNRPETTLVASIGICFAAALLARALGYSVALGAFIAGALIAESGEERRIAQLVEPVRDMFVAIFFVSVGMLIDPATVARHWLPVAVLTAVVVLGKTSGVSVGAFLTGRGLKTSVQAGMSLAQIGEFSFIIAGLGLSMRATGEFLYPVAVAVSAVTTLLTPRMIGGSQAVAAWVDRKLPGPLQTYAALYGSWLEEWGSAPRANTAVGSIRRLLRLLVLDGAVLAGILLGTSAVMDAVVRFARERAGLSDGVARSLVVAAAIALAGPFLFGVIRVGRRLGVTVARVALPEAENARVDFAGAPRRALVVTLELASIMLVGAPLIALTQPFLQSVPGAAVLALCVAALGVTFWRSTTNLQGHVRAGAQVIVEALASQSRGREVREDARVLDDAHHLLPGLGALVAVRLVAGSPAAGLTLAELNLRGLTGATVLAVRRGSGGLIVPSAQERLAAGDVLGLAGTHEAVEAAKMLLLSGPAALGDETAKGDE